MSSAPGDPSTSGNARRSRTLTGKAFRLHKCREMVWIDAESFGLTRDKLNRRPVFSGPLTRKEPVEPQGGIEPPICALPRRRNVPDRGKVELYSKAGQWLCLHEVEDKPESPPPFAQTLRRLLDNARVTAVEQRGLDRIAIFRVERGPERFDIVFEVFSRGNLVLVRDAVIVAVMFPQKFKDRDVQVGERYSYPVSGIDSLDLDRDGFAKALQAAKGQVVRILATVLNLGGTYAEELCLRAGVDKETRVKDLQDGQIDSLYTALNNIAVAIDQEGR